MTARLLLVEDDPRQSGMLATALRSEGHDVHRAFDAAEASRRMGAATFDLVVLDLGLPDRPGLDLLADLHRDHAIPVIVVSGRCTAVDRVLGIEMGADDYLSKPVEPRELAARVRRVLARRSPAPAPPDPDLDGSVRVGALTLDAARREAAVDGQAFALTRREFDLLTHLARTPRRVFSRDQLLRDVWGAADAAPEPRTVTEHVRRLRRKLPADARVRIETVRGVGYRLRALEVRP